MEKLDLQTPNFTDENIQKLSELFPNCVTEDADGKVIDFDQLRQESSNNIIEGNQECYQLTWPGKAKSIVTANTPINKTLRPNREESKDFDNTENLYIEGDNLEVLKLLQETYLGKIKMIYIDPPYNTGKDFVYKDNFTQDKAEYDEESGNIDDEGGRLISNPDSNGRYHSDWLSMIYPRLKLAKNLLKDDGVIFISLDDGEIANLKKICDEIFGENNFVGNIAWKKTSGDNKPSFAFTHDNILIYGKCTSQIPRVPLNAKQVKQYKNPDYDSRGDWAETDYRSKWTKEERRNLYYGITNPNTGKNIFPDTYSKTTRVWAYSEDTHQKNTENNLIWWGVGGNGTEPKKKRFLSEHKGVNTRSTWLDAGTNDEASRDLKKLIGGDFFDNPKPVELIKRFEEIMLRNNDIILDFFSGSSTTAHSVMQLNAEDDGNRKFIMVQIPEVTDKKSEAYKAGYNTITEIGKERIRRAGEKIKEDNADKEGIDDLDIGFRVLKVDSSNMKDTYYNPDNTQQSSLLDLASNIKDSRTEEDLLFQVLLDWGVDLTLKIERKDIAGKSVYFVDDDTLAACFEENINENFVKELAKTQPLRAVFKDSSFASDDVKINIEQIFKHTSVHTDIKVI